MDEFFDEDAMLQQAISESLCEKKGDEKWIQKAEQNVNSYKRQCILEEQDREFQTTLEIDRAKAIIKEEKEEYCPLTIEELRAKRILYFQKSVA